MTDYILRYIYILDSVCDAIDVRSTGGASTKQSTRMGTYKKENYTVNGKSVYKHRHKNEFLYNGDGGLYWMVILILYSP